jgi:prepilin-type N-terminal cleavage/methylation domain-containing protein
MTKAFSLIEIIIAVIIISVVGVGLLQVNSNSHTIYSKIFERTNSNQISSIGFVNFETKSDKKEQSLSEMLKTKYDIDNDDILKRFKDIKVYSSSTLINSIEPFKSEEEEEDNYMEESGDEKIPLTIEIYSVEVKVDSSNRAIFSITVNGEL